MKLKLQSFFALLLAALGFKRAPKRPDFIPAVCAGAMSPNEARFVALLRDCKPAPRAPGRQSFVLFKPETTFGTDPTLIRPAPNGIRFSNVKIEPARRDLVEGVDIVTLQIAAMLDPKPAVVVRVAEYDVHDWNRGYKHPFAKPSRPGVYARLYAVDQDDREFYCWWDGYRWSIGFDNIEAARRAGPRGAASDDQARLWRELSLREDGVGKAA